MAPKCPSVLDEIRPIERSVDAIRRNFARLKGKKKKINTGNIPEGFEKCPDCGDIDEFSKDHPGFRCNTCGGRGYVDWVENILGPKPKNEFDIDSSCSSHISHVGNISGSTVITASGGGSGSGVSSVGNHNHSFLNSIISEPTISEIKAGKGIKIEEIGHSHQMCGSGGMAVAMSTPTISVDIQSIKQELMSELEEQITNEVNRRLAAELLRRGIK